MKQQGDGMERFEGWGDANWKRQQPSGPPEIESIPGLEDPPGPPRQWTPPQAQPEPPPAPGIRQLALIGAILLGVIGVVVNFQPVSVLSGGSTLWIGAVLAAGSAVVAFVMHLPTWLKVVTLIVTVICLVNAVTTQNELKNRRDSIFGSLGAPVTAGQFR